MSPRGFQSPSRDIARFKEDMRIVHLSQVEQLKLLAGAVANPDRRFQVYVRLLHETGARTSEIRLRRWKDTDLDRGQILCGRTKTGTARVLFFTPKTAELIRRVWPKRPPDDFLFEGRIRGCPINCKASWEKLVTDIGRRPISPNTTCAMSWRNGS